MIRFIATQLAVLLLGLTINEICGSGSFIFPALCVGISMLLYPLIPVIRNFLKEQQESYEAEEHRRKEADKQAEYYRSDEYRQRVEKYRQESREPGKTPSYDYAPSKSAPSCQLTLWHDHKPVYTRKIYVDVTEQERAIREAEEEERINAILAEPVIDTSARRRKDYNPYGPSIASSRSSGCGCDCDDCLNDMHEYCEYGCSRSDDPYI